MKKFKVYITTIHEVKIDATNKEDAKNEVTDNLSDYYIDANLVDCNIIDCEEDLEEKE